MSCRRSSASVGVVGIRAAVKADKLDTGRVVAPSDSLCVFRADAFRESDARPRHTTVGAPHRLVENAICLRVSRAGSIAAAAAAPPAAAVAISVVGLLVTSHVWRRVVRGGVGRTRSSSQSSQTGAES